MTYCVGLSLERGLVFASDSRTNAGVDYVTTYSKMHVFNPLPDRLFVVMSAGNLATTQEVINHIQRDIDYPTGGVSLTNVKYMFEAAEYIGKVVQLVQQEHSVAFTQSGVSGETTLILGGQISGKPHSLILIYPQGNYISSSPQTPYLQIGESKYGKPSLDRIAYPELSLNDGACLTLVSLDATARSNITVGPPFEVAIYQKDTFKLRSRCVFDESDPYLISVREAWNNGINKTFYELPSYESCPLNKPVELEEVQAQAQSQQMMNPLDQSY